MVELAPGPFSTAAKYVAGESAGDIPYRAPYISPREVTDVRSDG
jgi:hypothetical protein